MSSNQTMSFQEWSEEIARHKRTLRYKPDCCGHIVWNGTFEDLFPKAVREKIIDYAIKEGLTDDPGVSGGIAALKEYDRLCEKMFGPKRVKTPEVFCVSTATSNDVLHRYIMDSLQELEENLKVKTYLFDTPKYVVSGEYIPFEWLKYNPYITELELSANFTDNPYCIIKLDNEKEKEKMDAKKCERCGKLYEVQDADPYIPVYFPGLPVSNWDKENYSESRIRKDNTKIISVNFRGGEIIDLCPECREKLKNFFESGEDNPNVIKKAEE